MQLEKNLWISGGYYVDFDIMEQLRIIGPNNELYCGLIDVPRHKIEIVSVENKDDNLIVKAKFLTNDINLYYPAMDDIRTVRNAVVSRGAFLSFLQIREKSLDQLIPQRIQQKKNGKKPVISYRRYYQEDKWYGTDFVFSEDTKITGVNTPYKGHRILCSEKNIKFEIHAKTNDINKNIIKDIFLPANLEFKKFGPGVAKEIEYFWKRTHKSITHMLTWGKTSVDTFGTILPRDWMESADLGVHDLTQETKDYMYRACLKNVNKKGEAWHEDVVGEYKFQYEIAGKDIFDRHMVDIEPHHILGLEKLSENFLDDPDTKEKTRLVAEYVIKQARENDLISFAKLPRERQTKERKYHLTGNWRDSGWAYKRISPVIAPFDVNVVFYPEALKILKKFKDKLDLPVKDIDELIEKWGRTKDWYTFDNTDKLPAYALALYDIEQIDGQKPRYKQFKVNHLDEAYLYTYGEVDADEILSFCKRLRSKDYFYTKSGPTIIAKNNGYGYTTEEYHGLVIWPKQVAFVILGLSKHLKKGLAEDWKKEDLRFIKETIVDMASDLINAFIKLKAIPEIYYDRDGEPRFYDEQPHAWTYPSQIQLWSAIGARRIIRKYYELLFDPKYQI